MPTKKRRVGFIPRSDVLEIIDKLSFESNLSNSKIINILVEEALVKRGLFNLMNKQNYNKAKENLDIKCNKIITETFKSLPQISDNYYSIDSEIYKKFIMFLHFQEKLKKSGI
tara:strand:+ start:56 stop:394 length:339 start_codon:yes stop_codon:yes gene_type:complete